MASLNSPLSLRTVPAQLATPRESTISMSVVRGLVEAVEHAGVPRGEFLRAAGVGLTELDSLEARTTRAEAFRLCELALDLTANPALGLHWIEHLSERVFVPVSHLLAHSSSLRQALEMLSRYSPLLSDHPTYQIVELDERVLVRCPHRRTESQRVQRFLAEMVVGGFWRLVRCFNPDALPDSVSFAYPRPAHHEAYARLFGGAERFGQPFTGIAFDRVLLDAPSPQRDDDVRDALQALAQQRLLRITQRVPYAQRVRDALLRQPGAAERADMESVARTLQVSSRSLRRLLAAEGTSFREAANQALALCAGQLLRDPQRTIQEVAYDMGFSDASTFHRAFKRWTGMTPSDWRATELR